MKFRVENSIIAGGLIVPPGTVDAESLPDLSVLDLLELSEVEGSGVVVQEDEGDKKTRDESGAPSRARPGKVPPKQKHQGADEPGTAK